MMSLDFDDLLLVTHGILKNNSEIRNKWQRRFRYLHVDEFQDVDHIQYEIIQYLTGEDSFLCHNYSFSHRFDIFYMLPLKYSSDHLCL